MALTADPLDVDSACAELERFEKSITLAEMYDDALTVGRRAIDASKVATKFDLIADSVSFSDRAVEALESLSPPVFSPARTALVAALRKSGIDHLHLGDIGLATARLQAAQRLLDDSMSPRSWANTHWSAAVLDQARRRPMSGLFHVLEAWQYYKLCPFVDERLRLRVQIADLALELADLSLSEGAYTSFDGYLRLAEEHLDKAYLRSHTWFPPDADATLPLARARFMRLTNGQEDPRWLIELTIERMVRQRDPIGYGLALTALADDLHACGRPNAARIMYINAYEFLVRSPAPGLALIPWRGFRLDEEFRIR